MKTKHNDDGHQADRVHDKAHKDVDDTYYDIEDADEVGDDTYMKGDEVSYELVPQIQDRKKEDDVMVHDI